MLIEVRDRLPGEIKMRSDNFTAVDIFPPFPIKSNHSEILADPAFLLKT